MHQVGDQPRLYNDAQSTNHQDALYSLTNVLHVLRSMLRPAYHTIYQQQFGHITHISHISVKYLLLQIFPRFIFASV